MFSESHKAAAIILENKTLAEGEAPKILQQALPASYSFQDLQEGLAKDSLPKKEEVLELILILHGCLENFSRLSRQAGDEAYIDKLSAWISQSVLPDSNIIPQSDIPSEQEAVIISQALETTKRISYHGFKCSQLVRSLSSTSTPTKVNPQHLLSCVVYSSRDAWITSSVSKIAMDDLSKHNEQVSSREFIVDFLLQSFIRPLFSKSKPSSITSTGRKAMPSSEPAKRFDVGAEKRDKPWKYEVVYAVTVLEWVVENSTEAIISQSWNMFIPPILTLLDDSNTPIRTRGLKIISAFLPKFSQKLLSQTGLGPVFEDAIHPTLLFLPSITPVEESLQLLPAAYRALGVLCEVQFPNTDDAGRLRLLDRIIRHGILPGYLHSSQILVLVNVLVTELCTTVSRMGVHSVKHLKDILPIIATILEDPFTTPELLHPTIEALEATIRNAWPRISQPVNRMVILKSLVICWTNLKDHKEQGIKEDLMKVSHLFLKVVGTEDEDGIRSQVQTLVEADTTLKDLLNL